MRSLSIHLSDDDKRLPCLYWTLKLHKSPVKHRFIAGSNKYTTRQLSSLLTKNTYSHKDWTTKYCSMKTAILLLLLLLLLIIIIIRFQRTTVARVVSEGEHPILIKYSRWRAQLTASSSQVQLLAFTWRNCLY